MTAPAWALVLPAESVGALGRVRGDAIELCETHDGIWLRGRALDDGLVSRLRSLPAIARYTLLEDGRAIPPGGVVPRCSAPGGPWTPISSWLAVESPGSCLGALPPDPIELTLRRGGAERGAELLLADFRDCLAWALRASRVRLDRLAFAVRRDRRALLRGTPLAPIRGQLYTLTGRLALPLGLRVDPPVDHEVVEELLEIASDEIALFDANGAFERVPDAAFVRATRSAFRATASSLGETSDGSAGHG